MNYKEHFIKEIAMTDLDAEFPFYTEENEDDPNNVEYSTENFWSDSPSANIDKVIDILNELKSSGSDRVYIYAHPDHRGYYFSGVKLEKK